MYISVYIPLKEVQRLALFFSTISKYVQWFKRNYSTKSSAFWHVLCWKSSMLASWKTRFQLLPSDSKWSPKMKVTFSPFKRSPFSKKVTTCSSSVVGKFPGLPPRNPVNISKYTILGSINIRISERLLLSNLVTMCRHTFPPGWRNARLWETFFMAWYGDPRNRNDGTTHLTPQTGVGEVRRPKKWP